jgi:hypothetical protein
VGSKKETGAARSNGGRAEALFEVRLLGYPEMKGGSLSILAASVETDDAWIVLRDSAGQVVFTSSTVLYVRRVDSEVPDSGPSIGPLKVTEP